MAKDGSSARIRVGASPAARYTADVEEPVSNTPEFSVSELSRALKRTVEESYGYVRVRGEISGLKRAASGHVYLALKDDTAVLDAVMWKGAAAALPFRPEDGLEVIATGKLTTYPGRSKYQIVIERMEPAGVGALLAQLEARKAKLAAEGLFDASRRRPLPFIPETIGIITSPTGAVIRDILHRLADRFPRHVIVWPVLVQGEVAAGQVAAAIAGFNALLAGGKVPRPDLLIVARGGGSIEDLWAFNEEIVVRAVAASQIPIITAVGHETDTTLVDFASDHRAPTPSAAAERAVPVRAELRLALDALALRADRAAQRLLTQRRERLRALAARQPSPRALLALRQQRFDDIAERLPRSLRAAAAGWQARRAALVARLRPLLLDRQRSRAAERLVLQTAGLTRAARGVLSRDISKLATMASRLRPHLLERSRDRAGAALATQLRLLDSLNPLAVLGRGYALVTTRDGRIVASAAAARDAAALTLTFADAKLDVTTGVPVQGKLF